MITINTKSLQHLKSSIARKYFLASNIISLYLCAVPVVSAVPNQTIIIHIYIYYIADLMGINLVALSNIIMKRD